MTTEIKTQANQVEKQAQSLSPRWLNVGAALAAIGASLCCVGPFVLVLLGLGGGWMSTLVGFAPVRPFFILLTVGLLGWGFWRLYLTPCEDGDFCALPHVRRRQRLAFWIVALLTLGLITFPWYAPFFLE